MISLYDEIWVHRNEEIKILTLRIYPVLPVLTPRSGSCVAASEGLFEPTQDHGGLLSDDDTIVLASIPQVETTFAIEEPGNIRPLDRCYLGRYSRCA